MITVMIGQPPCWPYDMRYNHPLYDFLQMHPVADQQNSVVSLSGKYMMDYLLIYDMLMDLHTRVFWEYPWNEFLMICITCIVTSY